MQLTRTFKFNFRVSLFSVFFFVLFLNLGFWQLERAEEKETILERDKEQQDQAPVPFNDLTAESELSGLPVRAKGNYELEMHFLLDNRVLEGNVGFEVLVPFRTSDGQLVLINRGFVPMGRTRAELPEIPVLSDSGSAAGKLYIAQVNSMAPEESTTVTWPMIVQSANPVVLQNMLGEDLYPHVLRLALQDDNALPRYWPSALILPAKHTGYALQWFSMAIAIALAFLFFSFRKEDD
jgi:surfeit locus 1 family protein